ncbi:MAG: hypothetical protein AVDCRST_MAG59-3425, partial [uncultured Thermomicrobiales bacterium]
GRIGFPGRGGSAADRPPPPRRPRRRRSPSGPRSAQRPPGPPRAARRGRRPLARRGDRLAGGAGRAVAAAPASGRGGRGVADAGERRAGRARPGRALAPRRPVAQRLDADRLAVAADAPGRGAGRGVDHLRLRRAVVGVRAGRPGGVAEPRPRAAERRGRPPGDARVGDAAVPAGDAGARRHAGGRTGRPLLGRRRPRRRGRRRHGLPPGLPGAALRLPGHPGWRPGEPDGLGRRLRGCPATRPPRLHRPLRRRHGRTAGDRRRGAALPRRL